MLRPPNLVQISGVGFSKVQNKDFLLNSKMIVTIFCYKSNEDYAWWWPKLHERFHLHILHMSPVLEVVAEAGSLQVEVLLLLGGLEVHDHD